MFVNDQQVEKLLDAYNDNKEVLEELRDEHGDDFADETFEAGYHNALEYVLQILNIKH